MCPSDATYIRNTYTNPSRLFISGHGEILSQEGTTQGDPLSMPWFSMNTAPLIEYLLAKVSSVKQVWLADDATSAGKLKDLSLWYRQIIEEGEKYGYFVNKKKTWLIVKTHEKIAELVRSLGTSVWS